MGRDNTQQSIFQGFARLKFPRRRKKARGERMEHGVGVGGRGESGNQVFPSTPMVTPKQHVQTVLFDF